MNYADKYINRLNGEGSNFQDAYLNQSKIIAKNKIINSPTSYKVHLGLDDVEIHYCVTKDKKGNKERKFIFVPDTPVDVGTYVRMGSLIYLLTTKYTNEITPTFEGKQCTAHFPVITKGSEIIIDYDDMGRPVTETQGDTVLNLPCILKMNDASTAIADTNEPINLLDNQVMVTIPYHESPSIEYNESFDLFKDRYRIIRINPSDSINGVGVLHITGEREGSRGGT